MLVRTNMIVKKSIVDCDTMLIIDDDGIITRNPFAGEV